MRKLFSSLIILSLLTLTNCYKNIESNLSFLTFNVWQEGTSVPNGLEKIRNVILEINPDVVCFVEVRNYNNEDWTTKIVRALKDSGKEYYRGYIGGDVSFISKYPLKNGRQVSKNKGKGTVVNFDLHVDEKTIVVSGVHLDYTYYASNLPRGYNGGHPDWKLIDDGSGNPRPFTTIDSVQAYSLTSTRDEAITDFLESVANETRPIVLMGDFNEPSWLDWTEKTKNMFNHNGSIIRWQTTKLIHNAGFVDVYRTYYPDEVENPGFTWPSLAHEKESTSWTPLADERDRIDYIFYKGNGIQIKEVALVGPKELYVYNKLETSYTKNENFLADKLSWPSDHKAVFAEILFR